MRVARRGVGRTRLRPLALDSSALVIRELTADARLTGERATLLKERIQDTNRVRAAQPAVPPQRSQTV
jgi:hypothetical protein